MDIVLSIPGWTKMKNTSTFGGYGRQKGLQKVNQASTKCQPSAANPLKNGENLEDGCQNSEDGFMSLEDFGQDELPFQ